MSPIRPLLLLALLTATLPARAQSQANDKWDGGYSIKAERRSDVVFQLRLAPALGWGRGYPNEASKLDDPKYLADTGAAAGFDYQLFVGGALRDWFTFGFGLEGVSFKGSAVSAAGGLYLLRTEFYPAWSLGGTWRDLGVAANFGIGSMIMKSNGVQVADGGAIGVAGIEVFHETLRTGCFALGPALGYSQMFSSSFDGNLLFLGVRSAFYTGP